MREVIILLTRVPKEGTTKTRLYDFLSPKAAVTVQEKMLKNLYNDLLDFDYEIKVFHSGQKDDDKGMYDLLRRKDFYYQRGNHLADRMYHAIEDTYLENPNCKILLIGSDIVDIRQDIIDRAFDELNTNDIVINPTFDGGYYLIGMKKPIREVFDVSGYGGHTVFENTILKLKENNFSYYIGEKLMDIDTKEDLLAYETRFKAIQFLAAGEYNINFTYQSVNQEKRVLRINTKSQMNLAHQMRYEYNTLKFLEQSGVTPKVFDIYENTKLLPYKFLTMEYLVGRSLDYDKDMKIAAYLLSKIHALEVPEDLDLIKATSPFALMYEECSHMASSYLMWDKGSLKVKAYIIKFLEICENKLDEDFVIGRFSIINTELNSGNFIIGSSKETSYVIDWEKAVIGECEQDLAHFLAPTTTFWKTDKILSKKEMDDFLTAYSQYFSYSREKFEKYLIFNCLRGVTWCAMAYKEYTEKEKLLTDEETFNKIKSYLSLDFLEKIDTYFDGWI